MVVDWDRVEEGEVLYMVEEGELCLNEEELCLEGELCLEEGDGLLFFSLQACPTPHMK